jgi:hypothetical protein
MASTYIMVSLWLALANVDQPIAYYRGFDVSKQLVGGIVIHTLNLLVSYISGKNEADPSNPCVW